MTRNLDCIRLLCVHSHNGLRHLATNVLEDTEIS